MAEKETSTQHCFYPSVRKCSLKGRESQKLVCDISSLLRSQSYFPFFMLVAFEGGSIFRAFLLLLSYPFLLFMHSHHQLKVMIFITFCGLRLKDVDLVTRAVLPKFYLENINFLVYRVFDSVGDRDHHGSRTIRTRCLPRVMVEGFLKEYLNVEFVKGTELQLLGQYYTGFLSGDSKHKAFEEHFGSGGGSGGGAEAMPDIGIGRYSSLADHDHRFLSFCKEAYVVTENDCRDSIETIMPRNKYPKPLIFHDGRLAFFPTPLATFKMFIWLPVGILLAIFRLSVPLFFPPGIARFLISATGIVLSFKIPPNSIARTSHRKPNGQVKGKGGGGVLYVCNHRMLLDPIMLYLALEKPVTAVTYSLSRFSELLSPIRTVRLTRDRNQDAKTIKNLLNEGDLVICPEGTTCREPYLLRFSSLFAELINEEENDIVPVAVNDMVEMFYPTTASGYKWLDPIFGSMNPVGYYSLEVLEKVPKEETVSGGKSCHEVANYVQKQLADALGFECTFLTRKDKYLMLTGNEGFVRR